MAILRSGILGQVRGKVAGVVGAQWKDKNYVREFIKPANPDTAAQKVQRALFASAVAFAKPLVGPVFNSFTDQFLKSMSGFNYFIKSNIAQFTPVPTYSAVKVTEGKLFVPVQAAFTASVGAGTVDLNWATGNGSNGLATDPIWAVIYNSTQQSWSWGLGVSDRSVGVEFVPMNTEWVIADVVHSWIFAVQYSGTNLLMISDSSYQLGAVVA